MADILLDETTGDLDLSDSGGLSIAYDGYEAAQRINLAINLNLGEFFTHGNYGLPWIEDPDNTYAENVRFFLGGKSNDAASYVAKTLDTYLESMDIIDTLTSSYEYDESTREFSYTFWVETVAGETIEFPPYLQQI